MKSSKVTQNSSIVFIVGFLIVLILTRFYGLTIKPVHFDESINGWFSSQVRELGFYRYDPNNYHGPLYFYLLRFFEAIGGISLTTLRMVPTVFSVLAVALFVLPICGTATWRRWVLVFLLISPAFVFFGRSGIHEMVFVFFQLVFLTAFIRSLEKIDRWVWAGFLIGVFGMTTLKETFAVTGFSAVVALLLCGPGTVRKWWDLPAWKDAWDRQLTILASLLLFFFICVFTGFFQNMMGLVDFFRAFLPWMKTGVHGSGHEKEFFYWLKTLAQAEPLAVVGFVAAFCGVFSKNVSWRFVSLFSLINFFIYSAIPYKTVWCILSIVWGFYLVLAFAVVETQDKIKRLGLGLVILIAGLVNVHSLYQSTYQNPIDFDHPYVYVSSTYQLKELEELLEPLQFQVQIGMAEQWPWPWILRDKNISSYEVCGKVVVPEMDVYFCDPEDTVAIETKLQEPYWKISVPFRQSRGESLVYLKKSVFPNVPFAGAETLGGEDF